MSKQFICALCREKFEKGWTEDEAQTELAENFPGFDVSECNVLCADCYRKVMKSIGDTKWRRMTH